MTNSGSKRIVLFSDGTGNSSAKVFKTNVWRMYEAVDLGPSPPDRRPQIAYYDDGVGTSAFKPLAVLGGVFGYGLKRNVLDLYKYAARNYRPGDDIHAFGFSRGAFTIRLVVALIASQGLVPSTTEDELDRRSRYAYRAFRQDWLPRRLQWPTRKARQIRDALTRWWDARRGRTGHASAEVERPDIEFVGVWDTVSAYGGPIVELTRAIDNWIFPLSMPDYQLNGKVRCARHALALDDERDAFHPLLWDEVHEAGLVAAKPDVFTGRLRQVWFTGMHSDVGGGYPDESLSYVSLLWMMAEAEKAGLRTLDVIKDRFIALASSAGPIHDSRKGVAGYYRYQPRRIAAWLEPVDPRTVGMRDPQLADGNGRQHGLLTAVSVHESVVTRIARGTDRYAPITLPDAFDIVPPEADSENVPQDDNVAAAGEQRRESAAAGGTEPPPLVSAALRKRLGDPVVQAARGAAFEEIWDLVWRRRVAYFVTVGLTLLLAAMPAWIAVAPDPWWLADGRTWIDAPLRMIGLLLPSVFGYWIDTFAENPFYFLVLVGLIVGVMNYGASCERRLRDRARGIWHEVTTIDGPLPSPAEPGAVQRLRNSPRYQRTMQTLKWHVLPDYVFRPLIAAAAVWLAAAGVTQTYLPWMESGSTLCSGQGQGVPELDHHEGRFATEWTCHSTARKVVQGRRYRIELRIDKAWFDGSHATNPLGLSAGDLGAAGYLGAPFRRVVEANYLQPVIEIRRPPEDWGIDSLHMSPLMLAETDPGVFAGEFQASHGGELFVFANDAVLPWWPRFFYSSRPGRNHGTASVRIDRLEEPPAVATEAMPRDQREPRASDQTRRPQTPRRAS